MKLSEAIRLGAMVHPQGFGALISHDWNGDRSRIRETCALGAAWVASGGASHEAIVTADLVTWRGYTRAGGRILILDLPDAWTGTLNLQTDCPERCGNGTLAGTIQHLNDQHHWTREQIADFVEAIERREESKALAAVDPHASDPGTLPTRAAESSSSVLVRKT